MTKLSIILNQTLKLTSLSLKARYRNTFAGFLWVILNPIIVFGAQSIAFKTILKIDLPSYGLFLMSNLLPWIFILNNIQMNTSIFEVKAQIIKSFKVNPLIFIFSQILDNFINFLGSFFILFIYAFFANEPVPQNLFLLPISLLILILGSSCLSIICAVLQIFFRDLKFVIQFILNIVFFVTPIFYPIEYIPEKFRILLPLNIFYTLIKPFSLSIYNFNIVEYTNALLHATGLTILLVVATLSLWKKLKNEFYINL